MGAAGLAWPQSEGTAIGGFDGHSDVETVLHPGSAAYDPDRRAYRVAGSGENMWAAADAFQYVWKKVSGDVTLTAGIAILGTGGDAHRKAALMIRQSLDADSAYADAALHGSGLTSLQTRSDKGGATYEIQSNVSAPKRLRLTKRGDFFYLWVAAEGEDFHFSGGSVRVRMTEPFYVGLAVCAHNKDAVETAEFTNVDLSAAPQSAAVKTIRYSTIETVPYPPSDRHATYAATGLITGPTWTRDGQALIFNHDGVIERLPLAGGKAEGVLATSAKRFQGALDVSPDGKRLAVTVGAEPRRAAAGIVPASGSSALKLAGKRTPSWAHGWSPDGETLLISAERSGKRDVFSVRAGGNGEVRLTTGAGVNDNPEYAPDGQSIYFNSDRGGSMQVWRMKADGSGQEQVTSDDFANWYPHISPDGKRLLVVSCDKSIAGPPVDREVQLRVVTLADKRVQVLARILMGGRGTIDSPAWAPDGRRVAFVTYQSIPQETTAKK